MPTSSSHNLESKPIVTGGFDPINVCLYFDSNYVSYAQIVLRSILNHLSTGRTLKVFGLTICDNHDKQAMAYCFPQIEFVWVDLRRKEVVEQLSGYKHVSSCSWARLLVGEFLPADIDRVIVLDCDVLVRDDLSKLFDHEIDDGKFAAAVVDADTPVVELSDSEIFESRKTPKDQAYFNAGVLLLRLDAWRASGVEKDLLHIAVHDNEQCEYGDQCALNSCAGPYIQALDWRWNYQTKHRHFSDKPRSLARIVHFTGRVKPFDLHFCDPFATEFMQVARDLGFKRRLENGVPFISSLIDLARQTKDSLVFRKRLRGRPNKLRTDLMPCLKRGQYLIIPFSALVGILWYCLGASKGGDIFFLRALTKRHLL